MTLSENTNIIIHKHESISNLGKNILMVSQPLFPRVANLRVSFERAAQET